MRILMNIKLPHEKFNAAVRDGSAGAKLDRILNELKPEAVYFTEQNGQRCGIVIVDLPKPSDIPRLSEPWFLTFDADVEMRMVMTPEDLKAGGLDRVGKQWA